jgi:hypothetical protein
MIKLALPARVPVFWLTLSQLWVWLTDQLKTLTLRLLNV